MPSDWSLVTIAGKPVDLFNPGPDAVPFSLLWLHDESEIIPEPLITNLHAHRLRCVAPRTGRSWWVDRICPEFDPHLTAERHILENVGPWMEATWRLPTRAVALAGIGMGGHGATRLALKYPLRFPIVASAAGAFDFHERIGRGTPLDEMYPSREHARQDSAILHVHPHEWPKHLWFACSPTSEWYRGNDRLHEKLAAIGVPHTADLDTRAAPEQHIPAMLNFIVGALGRESRRLM